MCEKLPSQIQIAGADAGKTYTLAEKILMRLHEKKNEKIIYAISYTNYAKRNIEQRVMELNNGQMPADGKGVIKAKRRKKGNSAIRKTF